MDHDLRTSTDTLLDQVGSEYIPSINVDTQNPHVSAKPAFELPHPTFSSSVIRQSDATRQLPLLLLFGEDDEGVVVDSDHALVRMSMQCIWPGGLPRFLMLGMLICETSDV